MEPFVGVCWSMSTCCWATLESLSYGKRSAHGQPIVRSGLDRSEVRTTRRSRRVIEGVSLDERVAS
ncbi:hypothetical protein BRC68_15915 [Halobacteriales archaeon QH_6_64_20]|nr:MAG: hypothetical protein BRC68_15915 [Halobacteriales archaeon QH_6_64_20]